VCVSWFDLKIKLNDYSLFHLKICGFEFLGLALKTGSYGLVIWTLKLSRYFFGLDLKINQVIVYQLRYEIDGRMKTLRDTSRDLTVYFG
jgi:hypothetical protein